MLADSSDEDEEELLQFMLSSAASARHTVELMMVDILEDNESDDSERENKARDFKGAYHGRGIVTAAKSAYRAG
jgi:hypothetical protein